MRRLLLVSVAAIWSAAAHADDRGAPNSQPGFNWTGAYVGAQAGYGWWQAQYYDGDYLSDPDPSGLSGYLYAGYNHQFENRAVVGLDAEIGTSNANGVGYQCYDDSPDICIANVHSTGKVGLEAAARIRLGYAYDRFLPYVAAGVSFARHEFAFFDDVNNIVPFRRDELRAGWNIGAGVDWAVSEHLIVRTEYRYSDYGSPNFDTGSWAGSRVDIDLAVHSARLGVAYKF